MGVTNPAAGPAAPTAAVRAAGIGPFADVSLEALMRMAGAYWRMLVASALAGAVLFVATSFLIEPAYRATIVVTPVNNDLASAARSGVAGQLGGLAALTGMNIGGADTKEEYLAFLRSRDFVGTFIAERKLLPVLFPPGRRGLLPWTEPAEPTLGEAVRMFRGDIYDFDEDKKTRIVTITVTWTDREAAAAWANGLVANVNQRLRARAIREAEANLAYLNAQLRQTNIVAMEQAIGRLIESETRTAMLARGREQYAFRVIDPATVPDDHDKVRPRRALMGALGLFLGGMAALLVALVRVRRRLASTA